MPNPVVEDKQIPEVIVDTQNGKSYLRQRFFGKGGFAKCYEIMDRKTNEVFAGKIVSKKLLSSNNQKEKMSQEIEIHKSLSHKHIVQFYDFFEDPNFVYIVLELCPKRSMMELHKRRKALTEPEVRYYMKQILEGVSYLHEKRIIHRDLKLGNLFLSNNLEVKIGDLGLAARIEYSGQRKQTLCGTPNYIAPEILNKKGHSFEVDVWSLGCIMYTLLVGKPPFETSSLRETYAKIKRCEYNLPPTLHETAAVMVSQMLLPAPDRRPTVLQLLDMPFMKGYCPKELPLSCLTMAPRFDSVKATGLNRKPLLEVNKGDIVNDGRNNVAKKAPRASEYASCGLPSAPSPIGEQCEMYLLRLLRQLEDLLKQQPQELASNMAEEMSDPAAHPFIWISKWVDYSDKYGFGYQLCDDGVGVMFNDSTKIVLLPNQKNVHYIEKDGTEHYHVMGMTPQSLEKKMKLLTYFRRYMSEHLVKAGASVPIQESDSLSRMPYLHMWHRSTSAVLMQLTNGTVQINFTDHKKIIMCPLMSAVTFLDGRKTFRTYRFSTIATHGCVSGLREYLNYAHRKIGSLLQTKRT